MKKLIILFIIFFISLSAGCKKGNEAVTEPEKAVELLKKFSMTEKIKSLYTDESLELLEKFKEKNGLGDEVVMHVLSVIPSGAEFEVVATDEKGNDAGLKLKFSGGVSENVLGLVVDLKLKKVGEIWKIDRTSDFRKMITTGKGSSAESYFDKK